MCSLVAVYISVSIWCNLTYKHAVSNLIFCPESFRLLSGSPDSTGERREATAMEKEFQEWFTVRKALKKERKISSTKKYSYAP